MASVRRRHGGARGISLIRGIFTISMVLLVIYWSAIIMLLNNNNNNNISNRSSTSSRLHSYDTTTSLSKNLIGTNLGPLRTRGSKDATVMAMASGYPLKVYRRFVGSLRKSGFEGNIILAIHSQPQQGVEEYLTKQNVVMKKLKFVNCTFDATGVRKDNVTNSHAKEQVTCVHPYPDIKIRWSRFPLLRDYLQDCEECQGPVLVCDARDTIFQQDPFGIGAPEVTGLQVFREHKTMTTAHWLTQVPIQKCKGIDMSRPPNLNPMLCSGTTIGTREAMLEYFNVMHQEMSMWMNDPNCCCNPMNGDDQSMHNYLFYTGKLPFATAVSNRMGIVHTAGAQGSYICNGHAKFLNEKANMTRQEAMRQPYAGAAGKDRWIGKEWDLVDDEGFFIDYDGGRSRVVHQYDRFGPPFEKYLERHRGKLWELLQGPNH